ncbi:MAG: type II secretion system protein [Hydrogenophaga sp.]|uniref:type II secretion system protein n=1 Tax=Hydrogenophaga sp. TaxID=1904254 RepID=UPI003D0FDF38
MTHTPHMNSRRRQRGLSLIEAALAMVIMGVASAMSWQTIRSSIESVNQAETHSHLDRAEAALLAYIALNNRLPCPASSPDGLENCSVPHVAGRQFFPYLTLGVPEPKLGRLQYVPYDLSRLPPRQYPTGQFHVRLNDQAISVNSAPRAHITQLRDVASTTYDGILDTCQALSRIGDARMNAFTLEQVPADSSFMSSMARTTRRVRAAQVSDYLSCNPLASVGGRSQYNAHLASAIMSKTLKEYKWIFEADYGTYNLDLAESAFNLSTKVYGELMRWPKTMQGLSKFFESRFGDFNAVRMMTTSVINQAASTAAVVAQTSNVQRFKTNLAAARARYRVILDLTRRADAAYLTAWQHAVLSSSSAYFLREQTVVPQVPPPLGTLAAGMQNPLAQSLIDLARNRADDFGAGFISSELEPLPGPSEVAPGLSNDFAVDTKDLPPDVLNAEQPQKEATGDAAGGMQDSDLGLDPDLRPEANSRVLTDEEIARQAFDEDTTNQELERAGEIERRVRDAVNTRAEQGGQ